MLLPMMTVTDLIAGESRAAGWLRAWDSQGTHRTATPGDAQGAEWLLESARSLHVPVAAETFAIARLDPVTAFLEIGDLRYPAVPVFDAPATGRAGLDGPLGQIGSAATIGVVELSPWTVYTEAYYILRHTPRHRALAIVCNGKHRGMGLLNAERFRVPYGVPAIHLDSETRDPVFAAAAKGASVRLVAHSVRTPAEACNIVVTIPGRDRQRAPIVVMTPRSSWWHSTSERGGGLVCWLETLRTLIANPPTCDVVLTANSGHELGHLGLDDFCARRPGWDQPGGAIWIHYGANLGAVGGTLSVMTGSHDLRDAMAAALRESGQPPDTLVPETQVPNGETRDIHRAGGRYLTLVGSNPLFHLPQDRWPHAVDGPAVARIAAGAAAMVAALAA
jgi:hypothetical protein